MKKLKKILLINWLYFSKELIEVDDINFLTGKKRSRKIHYNRRTSNCSSGRDQRPELQPGSQ